jgi:hypothetical protein
MAKARMMIVTCKINVLEEPAVGFALSHQATRWRLEVHLKRSFYFCYSTQCYTQKTGNEQ